MSVFGPTFPYELHEAGLGTLPIVYSSDGTVGGLEFLTEKQRNTLNAVIAAHDPSKPGRRLISKSQVISRLTEAQVKAAIGLMTFKQQERWRAPDKPYVYSDDPETLAVLRAIGADPAYVLGE